MNVTEETTLNSLHQQHLIDEGFALEHIIEWQHQGLESLTEQQAAERGFRVWMRDGWKSGSGLYIPFTKDFGQLRLDTLLERKNGNLAKYLTPIGAKSQAWIPNGCQAVTEGIKDGRAGTVHGGIPTGAIAGVSHYRKALPQGAGYVTVFDADGWTNPNVFSNLFYTGKWLNGKVLLLPKIEGQPKAGLCEFFKAGHTGEDYRSLINSAMKPEALLLEWPNHFKDIPAPRLDRAIHVAFRLAVEHLCDIQQQQILNSIRKATGLSTKILAAALEKERSKVLRRRRKQLEKNLRKSASSEISDSEKRKQQVLDRRAADLLDSGVLPELIVALLKNTGAIGIGDHVQIALASALGTIRRDRKRNMPVLFTGSSGIGKSMLLDILGDLLPPGSSDHVSGISDAVLKRIRARWLGKILLIDEFSTWANSDVVLSTLKELITRGEANFEILEQGKKGEWEIKRFDVSGPIGIAGCATDSTLSTVFGASEEEIRSRFNELPLPEDAEYISRISRAAFTGLEPESLSEKFPRITALIRRALEIAVSRKIPTIDPLLEEALWEHIKPDRPLFPRLMKRLKILLENTAALLGEQIIDLKTYAVVFPLVSKVFRRSLTSANDGTLDNFVRFARNLKDLGGGYLPFKIAKVRELLSTSQASAYRWRDKWESLGWVSEGQGRGLWNITGKGAAQIEAATEGKEPELPDILPPILKVRATMERISKNSHRNSHEILTRLNIPERPIYKGLSDFLAKKNSHEILSNFSPSLEIQMTPHQAFEVDGGSPNSQNSHLQGENRVENFSHGSLAEKNFSPHPPENNEKSENLEPQNRCDSEYAGDTGEFPDEKNVRTSENSERKTERIEPDYSGFPHRSSDNPQAKRNLATKIKEQLLAVQNQDGLATVKAAHGGNQVEWVREHLLSDTEQAKVEAAEKTEQLDLLSASVECDTPAATEVTQSLRLKVVNGIAQIPGSPLIEGTNVEIRRLGWDKQKCRQVAKERYRKTSRQLMTDAELLDLLHYLESQTPLEQVTSTSSDKLAHLEVAEGDEMAQGSENA